MPIKKQNCTIRFMKEGCGKYTSFSLFLESQVLLGIFFFKSSFSVTKEKKRYICYFIIIMALINIDDWSLEAVRLRLE